MNRLWLWLLLLFWFVFATANTYYYFSSRGNTRLNMSNGLFIIPMELSDDSSSNNRDSIISRVGVNRRLLTSPLYWELPKKVMHCYCTHPIYMPWNNVNLLSWFDKICFLFHRKQFLGDRIFSYNGFLRFTTWSDGKLNIFTELIYLNTYLL